MTSTIELDAALVALHPQLVRFARMQLRNDGLADDVASAALLAVMERPRAFEGRSSLRTYVTGILKHKITDMFRLQGRELQMTSPQGVPPDEAVDAILAAEGSWLTPSAAWPGPEAALQSSEFLDVLQTCVERLPPRLARVYMMREGLEHGVSRVCEDMAISRGNAAVMLHRARMQLRECLARNWFGKTGSGRPDERDV